MKAIELQEYKKSVVELIKVSRSHTGQARFAAQVILSAYNGQNWQLDITDLCGFDANLYEHALNVIRGRTELKIEPHELVDNGDEVFRRLQARWVRYHIANRWRSSCLICDGSGVVYDDDDENAEHPRECDRCDGLGLSDELPEQPNFGSLE